MSPNVALCSCTVLFPSCLPEVNLNFLAVTIISRSSLIASDLIVIVVTWFATYKTTKLARASGHKARMTLSVLLLRDGMIYFM